MSEVKTRRRRAGMVPAAMVLLAATILGPVVWAQPARSPPPPSLPPAAPTAPVPPAVPQRTTATFADWTLRCERPSGAAELCEIAQIVSSQGQPVAQIAFGRMARGEVLHLSMIVPPNVSFAQAPHLGGVGKDSPMIEMAWRRCLPGGCFAEAALTDDAVHQIRARTDATRLVFLDAAGKEAALPFSPHGLTQALDALAHEEGS